MSQHTAIAQVEPNGPMVKTRVPTPAVGLGELLLETRVAGINVGLKSYLEIQSKLTDVQFYSQQIKNGLTRTIFA